MFNSKQENKNNYIFVGNWDLGFLNFGNFYWVVIFI